MGLLMHFGTLSALASMGLFSSLLGHLRPTLRGGLHRYAQTRSIPAMKADFRMHLLLFHVNLCQHR